MIKRSLTQLLTLSFIAMLSLSVSIGLTQDSPELIWEMETIGEGIKPAIAVDNEGVAHIAYLTEALDGAVFYATNQSGVWETTELINGYFYGPVDIAVSPDGTPHIAYHDHEGATFDPVKGSGVIFFQEDGVWENIVIEDPGHDFWDNAIIMDENGFWHTTGVEPSQFGFNNGVEYATNAYSDDPEGFIVEATGSGPQPYEFGTSIDIASDGRVGVTFFDAANRDLVYAERSPGADGTWTQETVDAEGDVGRYSMILFDDDDNPRITYYLKEGTTTGTVRYAHRDSSGNWMIEDIGNLENAPQGFVGSRKITSFDFDSAGNVHAVYGDRMQIVYAIRTETGWTQQVVAESQTESGNLGSLVEFALDSDDKPHLTFFFATNLSPLMGEIVYATTAG